MADVKHEVVRVAAATSGTFDVTISGFGTPVGAYFYLTNANADDTIKPDLSFSVGATDGTRQNCCAIVSADAVATSDTDRYHTTSAVAVVHATSGTPTYGFAFDSFITDGVRLSVTTAGSENKLLTVVLVGGSDVTDFYVGHKDDLGTGTSAVDITDPGFEPDVVKVYGTANANLPPISLFHAIFAYGIGINDGSDTQRMAGLGSVDASSTTNVTSYISNNRITGQMFNGAASWLGTIGSYDASGFSITPNANSGSDIIFYVCEKYANNPDIALFDITWPTSGNYAETTPGFEPSYGEIVSLVGPSSRNTVTTSGGESLSVAVFDANNVYTNTGTDEDGVGTTVAKSLASDQLRILDPDGSTDSVLASSYAFDADGWDFTLSTNPSSAILGWGLAIGTGGGGGGGVSVSPSPIQTLINQYGPIAASKLGGLIQ